MADPGRGSREYQSGDLVRWYRSKMMKVQDGIDEAMDEAAEVGKATGRDIIRNRPWISQSKENGGVRRGRVESEKMLNAFGARKTTQGNSRQLRVGWVSGTREDYFQFQETGFLANGVPVEGLYALQDATDEAFRVLADEVRERIRRV